MRRTNAKLIECTLLPPIVAGIVARSYVYGYNSANFICNRFNVCFQWLLMVLANGSWIALGPIKLMWPMWMSP